MVRVVETVLGAGFETVDKRLDFVHLSVGNHHHGLASHGIDVLNVLLSTNPFSSNKVLSLIGDRHVPGIESSELVKVRERSHSADSA